MTVLCGDRPSSDGAQPVGGRRNRRAVAQTDYKSEAENRAPADPVPVVPGKGTASPVELANAAGCCW